MKCCVCIQLGGTWEQLLDRSWPPNAITIADGTAVCAYHTPREESSWDVMTPLARREAAHTTTDIEGHTAPPVTNT